MHVDLRLQGSLLQSNNLSLLQPVIINESHVAIVGASETRNSCIRRGSLKRFLLSESEHLTVSRVETILPAHSIKIFTK